MGDKYVEQTMDVEQMNGKRIDSNATSPSMCLYVVEFQFYYYRLLLELFT